MRVGGVMDVTERKDCKDCEERHAGCHSTCPIHKGFLEKNEKKKAALRKQREVNDIIYDYKRRKKKNLERKRHKKAT